MAGELNNQLANHLGHRSIRFNVGQKISKMTAEESIRDYVEAVRRSFPEQPPDLFANQTNYQKIRSEIIRHLTEVESFRDIDQLKHYISGNGGFDEFRNKIHAMESNLEICHGISDIEESPLYRYHRPDAQEAISAALKEAIPFDPSPEQWTALITEVQAYLHQNPSRFKELPAAYVVGQGLEDIPVFDQVHPDLRVFSSKAGPIVLKLLKKSKVPLDDQDVASDDDKQHIDVHQDYLTKLFRRHAPPAKHILVQMPTGGVIFVQDLGYLRLLPLVKHGPADSDLDEEIRPMVSPRLIGDSQIHTALKIGEHNGHEIVMFPHDYN